MTNFTFTHRQLRVMFIALLCALFTLPLAAQNREAYAKLSDDKTTLTFFYDTLRSSKKGTIWKVERLSYSEAPWQNGSKIKKMVLTLRSRISCLARLIGFITKKSCRL